MSVLIPLAISLIVVWPLILWLLFLPKLHRFSCRFYRHTLVLIGYFLGLLFLTLYLPIVLYIWSVICVGLILYERVRARPSFGIKRQIPPGSLSLTSMKQRPRDFLIEQHKKYGPVFKTNAGVHPCVCISDLDLGRKLLKNHDESLRRIPTAYYSVTSGTFIRYMKSSEHDKAAPIMANIFDTKTIENASDTSSAYIQATLEEMSNISAMNPDQGVSIDMFLQELCFSIFSNIFFGIHRQHDCFEHFRETFEKIDIERIRCVSDKERKCDFVNVLNLIDKISPFDPIRKNHTSFICNLHASVPAKDWNPVMLEDLLVAFALGQGDLKGFMRWIFKMLVDYPTEFEKLRHAVRNEPSSGEHSFPNCIIRETFRLAQSEMIIRNAMDDIEFEGYLIPKGWAVRVLVWEAHRLNPIYQSPEVFNPDRFLNNSFSGSEYAPLGIYRHYCMGKEFTRLVVTSLLTELALNYQLTVASDGPVEFGLYHWQPSTRLRIHLKPAR